MKEPIDMETHWNCGVCNCSHTTKRAAKECLHYGWNRQTPIQRMKAKLIYHRKVDAKKECICGSELKSIASTPYWVCPVQLQRKEQSWIMVER